MNVTSQSSVERQTALMTAVPACFSFSVRRLKPPVRTIPHGPPVLGRAVQQLWAAMHQLHQREVAAVLQPPHVHPRAGRIQARGHWVDVHWLRHGPPADYWSDWEGTIWPLCAGRSSPRRLEVPRGGPAVPSTREHANYTTYIRSRPPLNVLLSCLSARSTLTLYFLPRHLFTFTLVFTSRRVNWKMVHLVSEKGWWS